MKRIDWIKVGTIVFLAVYLGFVCMKDRTREVPIDTIKSNMEKDKTVAELKQEDEIQLRRFYGLEGESLEGVLFYKAESPMAVDELLIVRARDKKQAADVQESAEKHLEEQKKSFEGYGAAQTALLSEAYVENKGKYVIYAAGENAGNWREKFWNLVK